MIYIYIDTTYIPGIVLAIGRLHATDPTLLREPGSTPLTGGERGWVWATVVAELSGPTEWGKNWGLLG